jgi:hypothetical protein
MAFVLSSMERIVEPMREPVQRYAGLLRDLGGDRCKALTVFGAAVDGPFDSSKQTAHNVLVLDCVDLALLRRLSEFGAKLGKDRIAAPLVMTPDYIQASRDTFALELIEIQHHHVTPFGPDHFADLDFEDAHVRLQCERELKVSLMSLRQGLLAAAGREKSLQTVGLDVAEGLLRMLRGILWFKGRRDPLPREEVLAAVETVLDRKLPGLREAFDVQGLRGWDAFTRLYDDVEAVKKAVDVW